MPFQRKIRLTMSLFIFSILGGCGPIYDTSYTFTPPKERTSSLCISQCEDIQDDCEKIVQLEYDDCEEYNKEHYTRCSERIVAEKNRSPKFTECGNVRGCSSSTSECEARYRSCYQSCGGIVKEERVCIMNCSEEGKK